MRANFYMFPKRMNSTLIPTGSGTRYDVTLKDDTTVLQPDIVLKWTGSGSPTSYNYVYIPDFMRYYWISNWTYSERCWVASCSVDVLASYKTYIGLSEKYVLRSASRHDPRVLDTLYPAISDETNYVVPKSSKLSSSPATGGCYVLSVTGADNTLSIGGAGYYKCTQAQIQTIIHDVYNAMNGIINDTSSITDVQTALAWLGKSTARVTSNLAEYINGLMWMPFDVDASQNDVTVWMGFVNGGTGKAITNPVWQDIVEFNLYSDAPAAFSGDDWENLPPYANYVLDFMPFGVIPLDPVRVYTNAGRILCRIRCDVVTGLATLKVYVRPYDPLGENEDEYLIATRSAQLGVPIAMGGQSINYQGAISGALSGIAGAAMAATPEGAGFALLAGIGEAGKSLMPEAQSAGHTGGIAGISATAKIYINKLAHVPLDVADNGRPLCETVQISLLSGYVQCADGHLDISCTDGELEQLEQYLTGGFFYE